MILIADSGTTKTAWRFIDGKNTIHQIQSAGINPHYLSSTEIKNILREGLGKHLDLKIREIYFYGSGCSSDKNKEIIKNSIQSLYPQAEIEVNHDLIAAARALCGVEPGIACILGTGSNSCLYDGQHIVQNVTSMGYILGDEGSGNHLGRELIKTYLVDKQSDSIREKFDDKYHLTKSEILENMYQKGNPIRFFAQFSKFIFDHIQDPFCYRLVYDAFHEFVSLNVQAYDDHEKQPVHFVGSVAFNFSNILRQVCIDNNLKVGRVIQDPIAGLTLYHQEKEDLLRG